MVYVKMNRESRWGPAGKVVEVSEGIAYDLIHNQKAAVAVGAPKPKAARPARKKVSNKAMSAKD